MNLISSPGAPLHGTITLPGDKSLSHRAALFAALAVGESRVENFLVSGVTHALLTTLTAMGVEWHLDENTLIVQGVGLPGLRPPAAPLHCGNSATTIRFLAGALAAAGIPAVLDGSDGLRRRPMERIVAPLRQMSAAIEATDGHAPLTLSASPRPLKALDYNLPVASAQIKTCLLLAALAADGTTTLREPGPSRDHTERMLSAMGIKISGKVVEMDGQKWIETQLTPPRSLNLPAFSMSLPGDFSAAAFLIVAALVTPGSSIMIRNVGLNSTRTGLLDALLSMGADICISNPSTTGGEPVGDLSIQHSELHGITVNGDLVVRMIDEFPAFAVAAAFAKGETRVEDALELRHKESDRISAMCQELSSLGAHVREQPDGFSIEGGKPLAGGVIQPHGDHRLAMSLAVAGLAAQNPLTVTNAEMINESFPEFLQVIQKLGGHLSVEPQYES